MTDKQFVRSIYPKARVIPYGLGFYIRNGTSYTLSGICDRIETAWHHAKHIINDEIIEKLEK